MAHPPRLVTAESCERKIVLAYYGARRDEAAVGKYLAVLEIVLQSVADDEVGAEQHEPLHVMGQAQPDHQRGDDGGLAAAGDHVQQHAVGLGQLVSPDFVGINGPQQCIPLVFPQRAFPGLGVILRVAQVLQVVQCCLLGVGVAVSNPLAKILFMRAEFIDHCYLTSTLPLHRASPPRLSCTRQATVNWPECGNLCVTRNTGFLFLPLPSR